MSLLKIARMGHPVLDAVAPSPDPALLEDATFQRLIDDMIETMYDEPGVGLAAPQVHVPLRLLVMDPGEYLPGGPYVVIDPVLTFPREERFSLWEGCLSVPGLRGETERYRHAHLAFRDRHGEARELSLEGFAAAVAQHEYDHLDGVLFVRRVPDLTRLAYEEEFLRHHAEPPADEDDGEEAGED